MSELRNHSEGPATDALSFESVTDDPGLEVVDSLERRRYTLYTPSPVRPTPARTDRLLFPVDAAVAVTTSAITLREVPHVSVRDVDGRMVAAIQPPAEETLPEGTYSIELGAPIKLYLRVTAPVSVDATFERVQLGFDGPTEVCVGARSHHRRPAATVRTTADPVDVAAAVSTFGSALKTTTPERSYPTLRGHPPAVELGDELDVPDGLESPDTGVTVEVPSRLRDVFAVASLAYYLGADVVTGGEPRLVTDRGFAHDLDPARGFEDEVGRVLRQVVFLDCLVRTEGYYDVDLYEREAVADAVDLDLAACYDRPLAAQVEAYLGVPFDAVEDHLPTWQVAAYVDPDPAHVAAVPFLVDDLAVIRTPDATPLSPAEVRSSVLESYLADEAVTTRGGGHGDRPAVVRADDVAAREQVWFGDYLPLGASKGVVEAYRNDLARSPRRDTIDITVVCNESTMGGERDAVAAAYGDRVDLPFDVTVHRDLSRAGLREALAADTDFLHYIGHIDDHGFRCADGTLDAASLESVGVDAFLLNACRSYEQGRHLVERGSVGGSVTFSDVVDRGAVEVGSTMARLLNLGFPLRAALSVAREESVVGGHYLVVGKGNVEVAHDENSFPVLVDVTTRDDGEYDVAVSAYLPTEGGVGSMAYPCLEANDHHYLAPGHLRTFRLTRDELDAYLMLQTYPLRVDGELVRNDDVGAPSL